MIFRKSRREREKEREGGRERESRRPERAPSDKVKLFAMILVCINI